MFCIFNILNLIFGYSKKFQDKTQTLLNEIIGKQYDSQILENPEFGITLFWSYFNKLANLINQHFGYFSQYDENDIMMIETIITNIKPHISSDNHNNYIVRKWLINNANLFIDLIKSKKHNRSFNSGSNNVIFEIIKNINYPINFSHFDILRGYINKYYSNIFSNKIVSGFNFENKVSFSCHPNDNLHIVFTIRELINSSLLPNELQQYFELLTKPKINTIELILDNIKMDQSLYNFYKHTQRIELSTNHLYIIINYIKISKNISICDLNKLIWNINKYTNDSEFHYFLEKMINDAILEKKQLDELKKLHKTIRELEFQRDQQKFINDINEYSKIFHKDQQIEKLQKEIQQLQKTHSFKK
jgi:hypothetical protein